MFLDQMLSSPRWRREDPLAYRRFEETLKLPHPLISHMPHIDLGLTSQSSPREPAVPLRSGHAFQSGAKPHPYQPKV